ncbi:MULTISPECIES: alpha/beta fold hydrolase [unclassified Paenibacillus]|uniref:alpha/beta fold hydrolase n=1 Tax=unclassified Paenibacillus TaxID=185978 RepID=UPI001AE4DBBC|nr:pimeloyl-ACP methyl ester carboxylesterase [Paenibacillus sp. PvP091]MBP1170315.1 pimeloyl-ACP methyl ester carboxylesterase [Paenibacillus sp. PvR098]MBP2441343.1 pimeloyl-ACP methyl ester carboxylesterase [Paenibacillus sp. PvP052]
MNWDQRGSGKSYSPLIPSDSMTVDQLISDAHDLTQHLLRVLGKHKLYIMGHSMGALLGMLYVHRYPKFVKSYVGVNQPVNRKAEEEMSYAFIMQMTKDKGLVKAVQDLERIGSPEGSYRSLDDLVVQRTWLTKLGGGD